jgi:hypothetical protein
MENEKLGSPQGAGSRLLALHFFSHHPSLCPGQFREQRSQGVWVHWLDEMPVEAGGG